MKNAKIEIDDVNLEDLIVLGEEKKIPIEIEFPKTDGTKVKAKALIKQLTLKELDHIKIDKNDITGSNITLLKKSLFKSTGDPFSKDELLVLPMGVVDAIANKVMEVSGVDNKNRDKLMDF